MFLCAVASLRRLQNYCHTEHTIVHIIKDYMIRTIEFVLEVGNSVKTRSIQFNPSTNFYLIEHSFNCRFSFSLPYCS